MALMKNLFLFCSRDLRGDTNHAPTPQGGKELAASTTELLYFYQQAYINKLV
jgi:hypothetical protein